MVVLSYAPAGFDGNIVRVEVDIKRGIPGIEIVGLPDGAVRESRERVRAAVKNSGYAFPRDRILVNLSPAGVRKIGASFDLSIAMGILHAGGIIPPVFGRKARYRVPVMILGELNLSGDVRPVSGVLSAVAAGVQAGVSHFLVSRENTEEARGFNRGEIYGARTLEECVFILSMLSAGKKRSEILSEAEKIRKKSGSFPGDCCRGIVSRSGSISGKDIWSEGDYRDVAGQRAAKRGLAVAAAGRHHTLLFGPPGSGKTMSALRLPSILPPLREEESMEVTRIFSLAGMLSPGEGLINRPPFRMPHHTATAEGLIGGGKSLTPGEVSLAHRGVLFLDETSEFRPRLIQSLREPIETKRVDLSRAGERLWFPADFQLVLAINPCPCGNLGRDDRVCVCTEEEIRLYWKRISGAFLDRIDMRIPVLPVPPESIIDKDGVSSVEMGERVARARDLQNIRFKEKPWKENGSIPPGEIEHYCPMSRATKKIFVEYAGKLSLSTRACHSVLKIARTIADMEQSEAIEEDQLLEAIEHRRYGVNNWYWNR